MGRVMRNFASVLGIVVAVGSSILGCATVALKEEAAKVVVAPTAPTGCKSLGMVYGQGGGRFTVGQYVSNEKLAESALVDARNKAAAIGATHIVPSPVQITGDSSTAALSAAAYGCP